ncbi:5-(carboxyamino)imidazole ribonucleotide synthase [Pseudoclavibacter helvolus]|nr:5-(carboxyamino)imidazole ribonucleotide synthase [Pseudoclavibacter helvolus]
MRAHRLLTAADCRQHFRTERTMGQVVGVIGAGQLARMMLPPAIELDVDLRVFAAGRGESADRAVTAVGDMHVLEEVLEFARGVDVVTFDHEHVPQDVLRGLVDAGIAVRPGPHALQYAQDKLLMRQRLAELGIPIPEWAEVRDETELQSFIDANGGVAVLKTPRGGYDGKGVRIVRSGAEGADWFADGNPLLVEERVDFRRELAQLVARRPSGEIALWPIVETVQRDGVCAEVLAPAPGAEGADDRLGYVAATIAQSVALGLDVTGVLAVELFETTDQRILVNELAMRPHNSGHWTIDGSMTSQFEQHLRAVLDLPLGDTGMTAPHAVMVNVLGGPQEGSYGDRYEKAMHEHPDAKIHSYGKSARPGRKVGHVTVAGQDLDDVTYRARAAAGAFDDNSAS